LGDNAPGQITTVGFEVHRILIVVIGANISDLKRILNVNEGLHLDDFRA